MIFDLLKTGESQTKEVSISNKRKKPATEASISEPFSAVFSEIAGAFPENETIYFDENFCIEDENGFYTENKGYGQVGSTDENGKLTIYSTSLNFGFLTPLNNQFVENNETLTIKVNYPSSTTSVDLYYTVDSGTPVSIVTGSSLKSFDLDLSAVGASDGDPIDFTLTDSDDSSNTATVTISIIESSISITSPLDLSSLKIDENIEIEWNTVHTSEVDIYVAYDGGDFELIATTSLTQFTLEPESASSLTIKVVDSGNSNIYDSVSVELSETFLTINSPAELTIIEIDTPFYITGSTNASYINIYASSTTATDILLAENVQILEGDISSSLTLDSSDFQKGEPIQIVVSDIDDSTNLDTVNIGIQGGAGGVVTTFELGMTTESSNVATEFLEMSATTESIIGDEY